MHFCTLLQKAWKSFMFDTCLHCELPVFSDQGRKLWKCSDNIYRPSLGSVFLWEWKEVLGEVTVAKFPFKELVMFVQVTCIFQAFPK